MIFLMIDSFIQIQNLSHLISFKMTSSTWSLVLHTFGRMVEMFLGGAGIKRDLSGNVAVIEATKQCLETVRFGLFKFFVYLSIYFCLFLKFTFFFF